MLKKPVVAALFCARGKRNFIMRSNSSEDPRAGVAKTFTGIPPPARIATPGTGGEESVLAPFRTPTQLAADAGENFRTQDGFPFAAGLIGETDPREVENLMQENSFELAAARENPGIEQDVAAANGRGRVIRPERAPHRHANGTPV